MTSTAITASVPPTVRNTLAWSTNEPSTLRQSIGHIFSNLGTVTALATVLAHPTVISYAPTAGAPDFGRRGAIQSEASRPDLKLITKIRSFEEYPVGWDGFDGVPPTKKAVREAVDFIKALTRMGAETLPLATVAGDGEILLLWKDMPFYLSISFSGDGTYSFYAEDENGHEVFADDVGIVTLPAEIVRLLT